MSEGQVLPKGWVNAKLGEICHIERGITFPASAKILRDSVNSIACLRTANVQATVSWHDLIYIPREFVKSESKLVRQEDILISMANSKELVGKVSFVNQVTTESTFGAFIAAIRSEVLINSKYLFYYLRSSATQQKLRETASQTVNIANLSLEGIYSLPIFVPPLPEQQRIVEVLEQQLSRLDSGVAALRSTQQKLKRYRAAVLKAAVEGKLTEEWRADHSNVEPALELLKRILQERRARWEEEQRAKGRDPQKMKYEEPAGPDAKRLPELPEGWCWATIEQIAHCLDYKRIPINKAERSTRIGAVPYYGANGQVGWIDDYIFDEPLVLVVEDETFFGREIPFSYKITGKSWVNNHAHVLRPTHAVHVDYLNSSLAHYPFTPLTQGTTGRRKLTQKALLSATYALPSLAEQEQIVSLVEERLSIVSTLESTIQQALRRAERMRQSILHKAFSGQLVEQDPSDEPASVLLERIRREREQQDNGYKKFGHLPYKHVSRPVKRVAERAQTLLPLDLPEPIDTETTIQGNLWSEMEEQSEK